MSKAVSQIRKAIDTLIEFELSEAEIAQALNCGTNIISSIRLRPDRDIEAGVAERLIRFARTQSHMVASDSITRLHELGVSQKTIALDVGYNEGTISRVHNDPDWAVSIELALKLRARLKQELDRLAGRFPAVDVVVIDTCPAPRAVIDDGVTEQLNQAFRAALRSAITGSLPSVEFPKNVRGALAALGPRDLLFYGMLLRKIVVDEGESDKERGVSEARQLETLIHELFDLIRRLQIRVDQLRGSSYRPDGAF